MENSNAGFLLLQMHTFTEVKGHLRGCSILLWQPFGVFLWVEKVHALRADGGEHFSAPPFQSSQWTVLNELYLCQLQGFEAECDYSGYQ